MLVRIVANGVVRLSVIGCCDQGYVEMTVTSAVTSFLVVESEMFGLVLEMAGVVKMSGADDDNLAGVVNFVVTVDFVMSDEMMVGDELLTGDKLLVGDGLVAGDVLAVVVLVLGVEGNVGKVRP